MKIEVGKRYVRRDGTITDKLVECGGWALDPDSNLVYGTEGNDQDHLVLPLTYLKHDKDLVREFTDLVVDTSTN